jgi:hypothetical protein
MFVWHSTFSFPHQLYGFIFWNERASFSLHISSIGTYSLMHVDAILLLILTSVKGSKGLLLPGGHEEKREEKPNGSLT